MQNLKITGRLNYNQYRDETDKPEETPEVFTLEFTDIVVEEKALPQLLEALGALFSTECLECQVSFNCFNY